MNFHLSKKVILNQLKKSIWLKIFQRKGKDEKMKVVYILSFEKIVSKISIDYGISPAIFETNQLLQNKASLIEYAAFYYLNLIKSKVPIDKNFVKKIFFMNRFFHYDIA